MQILDQTGFKIFQLHIKNQTPRKVLQMRQHASTGFDMPRLHIFEALN